MAEPEFDTLSVTAQAKTVLQRACALGVTVATAESCTGGLLSAVLTEAEGVSHAFDRGYVVYTDDAKQEVLEVGHDTLDRWTAVSGQCAQEMAQGALERSHAVVAVSITGYADASADASQAGLVFFGLAVQGRAAQYYREVFSGQTRARVRLASLKRALEIMEEGLSKFAARE